MILNRAWFNTLLKNVSCFSHHIFLTIYSNINKIMVAVVIIFLRGALFFHSRYSRNIPRGITTDPPLCACLPFAEISPSQNARIPEEDTHCTCDPIHGSCKYSKFRAGMLFVQSIKHIYPSCLPYIRFTYFIYPLYSETYSGATDTPADPPSTPKTSSTFILPCFCELSQRIALS